MKIGELAARSGLSAHTIRYYEKIGLLPAPSRDGGGRRDYGDDILAWIGFLGRLKTTGMPLAQMRLYAQLRSQGPATEAARKALLERHRDDVRTRLADLGAALDALDTKIASYGDKKEIEP